MEKQDGNKKRLFIIGIAVLALLLAAGGIFVAYKAGKSKSSGNTSGIIMEENASEWDKDLENLSGEQQGIQIPGYGEITVPAGEKTWKITLANPGENNCYFQYSVTIDDEETPVYESDYIEPGKAVTEFEVSQPLEAGEYTIHMNIATYSMDGTNTRLNGADVKADLHVID